MSDVVIALPSDAKRRIWEHLLSDTEAEQAAFAFVRAHNDNEVKHFHVLDWVPVPARGFEARTAYYMELTDEARAGAIKRAHDLGASMVELHSHIGPWPAAFSPSDWSGFQEFVPHVWWRLKGRPYFAIVVADTTFDALAWIAGPAEAERVDYIVVDGVASRPTGLSPLNRAVHDE